MTRTYLDTWCVVPRGPGRASMGKIRSGMSRSHHVLTSAFSSCRVVHLGRSLSSIYGFEALAVVHSFLLPVCCSSPRSHGSAVLLVRFFPLLKTVSKY